MLNPGKEEYPQCEIKVTVSDPGEEEYQTVSDPDEENTQQCQIQGRSNT